jgi:ribonuclease BN (tRNA processing enzyme)
MTDFSRNAFDIAQLTDQLPDPESGLLVAGASGTGKSTLACRLTEYIGSEGDRTPVLLDADPGTPTFGPPGAAATVVREGPDWTLRRLAGIATLDAGRFRLPLVTAVRRLAGDTDSPLIVDSPGLHRGTPAAELLPALATAADLDHALVVGSPDEEREVTAALRSAGCRITFVDPSEEATRTSTTQRASRRTEAWDEYLADGVERLIPLADIELTGTHPPIDNRDAWDGRQVALLDGAGETLAMGEVTSLAPTGLNVRTPDYPLGELRTLVARDARRNDKGRLRTDDPDDGAPDSGQVAQKSPFTLRESPNRRLGLTDPLAARAGLFRAILVGGFFDDPTILVRRIRGDESFLFDLGAVERYPTRVLNKVTNVFVTHAHTDHFAGFVRLLRTRVHLDKRCRLFGPPGIADRVESLVRGFTWDRLGEGEGPVFEVAELHDTTLQRWRIEAAGPRRTALDCRDAPDGLLFDRPRFQVRAVTLDHGTDVLGFTLEEHENYAVRSDRLEPPYEPGPWLGELKQKMARGASDETVELPDGEKRSVARLADHLLLTRPGEKLTYATDFGDTTANRRRIVEFARNSDIFICEAFYTNEQADKADEYGHLTAGSCAEIAREADVDRLIPFHFSSRYDHEPERLYRQILDGFDRVEIPELVIRRLDD